MMELGGKTLVDAQQTSMILADTKMSRKALRGDSDTDSDSDSDSDTATDSGSDDSDSSSSSGGGGWLPLPIVAPVLLAGQIFQLMIISLIGTGF